MSSFFDDDEDTFDSDVADTEALLRCPYCGEEVEIGLDPAGGRSQQYVEDCPVCCQPLALTVHYDDTGRADVYASTLDE